MAGRSEWLALNGWPGVTGRRRQKGAVGIIFDMRYLRRVGAIRHICTFFNFLFLDGELFATSFAVEGVLIKVKYFY
jgi:hypothetical protein